MAAASQDDPYEHQEEGLPCFSQNISEKVKAAAERRGLVVALLGLEPRTYGL